MDLVVNGMRNNISRSFFNKEERYIYDEDEELSMKREEVIPKDILVVQ